MPSRVLTDRGIEARKTNGKKVYDVALVDLEKQESFDDLPF